MFSVKGWTVSAPLKKQTEQHVKSSEAAAKKEQGKKNLKRKRPDTKDAVKVSGSNVEELWDQLKEPSSKPPKKKHDQKDKVSKPKAPDAIKEQQAPQPSEPTASAKPPPKEGEVLLSRKARKAARKQAQIQSQPPKPASSATPAPPPKLTPLQTKMASKLSSARFRHLNEQLYTTPSSVSQSLFTESPDLFEAYHTGFRQQVSVWPSNPVTGFIADVRRRAKNGSLPQRGAGREAKGTCVLADLGCGDGTLAKEVLGGKGRKDEGDGSLFGRLSGGVKVKIHSFDLQSPNEFVFAADIASLPLPAGSVDVAVFCLALMGTNWPSFIDEAWRILRDQGELWIAEIKSRFARASSSVSGVSNTGTFKDGTRKKIGDIKKEKEALEATHSAILEAEIDGVSNDHSKTDSTDVSSFILMLRAHGFELAGQEKESVDVSNKMFVKMRFVKTGRATNRGKNVGAVVNTGVQEQRFNKQKKRYLDSVDDKIVPEEEEAKILKPCVYKLR